jgi:hypothetical protein
MGIFFFRRGCFLLVRFFRERVPASAGGAFAKPLWALIVALRADVYFFLFHNFIFRSFDFCVFSGGASPSPTDLFHLKIYILPPRDPNGSAVCPSGFGCAQDDRGGDFVQILRGVEGADPYRLCPCFMRVSV